MILTKQIIFYCTSYLTSSGFSSCFYTKAVAMVKVTFVLSRRVVMEFEAEIKFWSEGKAHISLSFKSCSSCCCSESEWRRGARGRGLDEVRVGGDVAAARPQTVRCCWRRCVWSWSRSSVYTEHRYEQENPCQVFLSHFVASCAADVRNVTPPRRNLQQQQKKKSQRLWWRWLWSLRQTWRLPRGLWGERGSLCLTPDLWAEEDGNGSIEEDEREALREEAASAWRRRRGVWQREASDLKQQIYFQRPKLTGMDATSDPAGNQTQWLKLKMVQSCV